MHLPLNHKDTASVGQDIRNSPWKVQISAPEEGWLFGGVGHVSRDQVNTCPYSHPDHN